VKEDKPMTPNINNRKITFEPLSQEHKEALQLAMQLRRAGTEQSKESAEEIREQLSDFWENGGLAHFREEEELILSAYARYQDVDEIPEVSTMLLQHVKLRSLIQQILEAPDANVEKMRLLGKMLGRHIRLEERVIFPMIVKSMPIEALSQLGMKLRSG